jgi:hypothetical protein
MHRFFLTHAVKVALFSFEMTNHHLVEVQEYLLHLKWVILALHNSLQVFIATAICGTNFTAAIEGQ